MRELRELGDEENKPKPKPDAKPVVVAEPDQNMSVDLELKQQPASQPEPDALDIEAQRTGDQLSLSQIDTPDVPIRFGEKKRLHWAGKTCTLPDE